MTGDPCPSCRSGHTQKLGRLLHQCHRCRFAWEVDPPKPFVVVSDLVVTRPEGKFCVEVARCVHCECITIGPTGRCSCGAEHYPVAFMVELGEAWDVKAWLGGE